MLMQMYEMPVKINIYKNCPINPAWVKRIANKLSKWVFGYNQGKGLFISKVNVKTFKNINLHLLIKSFGKMI